jgi:hypothetical protein
MIKPASSSTPNKIAENYRLFPYFKTACFHISRWATLCRTDLHICTPYFKVNHALYIFVQHKRLTICTCLSGLCWGHWWHSCYNESTQKPGSCLHGRKHYTSQNMLAVVDFYIFFRSRSIATASASKGRTQLLLY